MQRPSAFAAPIGHILICGGGLAAHMTAAALARQLPAATRITLAATCDTASSDLFYGTVSAPLAYAFNLAAGVDEPALVQRSDTGFSWGTRYTQWGGDRAWTQCFALPFPILDGVQFHQYLASSGAGAIEPFLVSARAAQRGAFAHPPRGPGETGQHPLARADYAYQFDPAAYSRLFAEGIPADRVERITGELADELTDAAGISGVRLRDGRVLAADLYIDCTGTDASLLSRLVPEIDGTRRIGIAASDAAPAQPDAPLRTVTAAPYGWVSDTPLRGRVRRTSVYDLAQAGEAMGAHGGGPEVTGEATLGARREAWSGNCVGIGHAAAVVEPLTPAPLMLLERDIERLLALLPNAGSMTVERAEYNRRFGEDHSHAALFTRALFEADGLPDTPYWRAARAEPVPPKLQHKIGMFESRGVLVAYDLEPFHPEDWTILHLGMGRRPARHDRLADRADPARVSQFLAKTKHDIEQVVAKMPASGTYRAQLEQYLERTQR
ncbi:tryptophan 7-halogenase [Sphingomonas sp. S1-29]|uniref:tryptophan 7-halogenase n=1 Tax=Sphingomonas sp. S1-29 TaxID=2991074 RepID=UPI0022409CC2|nr:tryptophan 7-halogenase [Sphingomonas sp. S1-29]UZK69791.1 tryptophan 7-halogenase [Sphingomonas sp. S1-29]